MHSDIWIAVLSQKDQYFHVDDICTVSYKIVLSQFRLLRIQNIQKYKLLYWLAMLKYYILNYSVTLSHRIRSITSRVPKPNITCNITRTPCTLCHFRRDNKLLIAASNVTELYYAFVRSKSLNWYYSSSKLSIFVQNATF